MSQAPAGELVHCAVCGGAFVLPASYRQVWCLRCGRWVGRGDTAPAGLRGMRPAVEVLEGGCVALRAPKALYILTVDEVLALLRLDVATWRRAIARGKAEKRALATARRAAVAAGDAELARPLGGD